jgi:uncharacterized circularly permuted ATP-grasp superfamily protein
VTAHGTARPGAGAETRDDARYVPAHYDELIEVDGRPRAVAQPLWRHLSRLGLGAVEERQRAAAREIRTVGVTFGAGEDDSSPERPWPFDVIPRIVDAAEWAVVEAGLAQRVQALNCFIDDVYHDQRVLEAGEVPWDLVVGSPNFRPECMGVDPRGRVWAHVCGSDLVRGGDGTLYVLEDNLRVPSGVAYLLENRLIAKHVFPELFRSYSVEPVDQYVGRLAGLFASLAPLGADPRIVVLTPGPHNSAYYEHAYLAQQLGVDLVVGADLVVGDDEVVYVRTIGGLERVDVVYRRIDDLFLDPEVFRADSLIGVPGIMRAWRAGKVAIVNAPGTGVADDKGVYPYVGHMIRYYLGEEPILPSVPTWRCAEDEACRFVLGHLATLVAKPANESGGYGVVVGPTADDETLGDLAARIEQFPAAWVAQPVLDLSTMPTLTDAGMAPRHVDLRPFSLLGPEGGYVTPGGLTRVALRQGSLIVNSSQGGGSKDTWVVSGTISDPSFPETAVRPGAAKEVGTR